MYFKRSHTSSIILLSALILFTGYLINLPAHKINRTASKRDLVQPLNLTESYISQEHTVVTEDGYILKVFRIYRWNCKRIKPPVILMHGLLQSSDVWLDAGNAGLAYLLVNSCFDLWIGNQRGNYHGRRHRTLNPDADKDFWDFSVDEIGLYDVPATIDYVLEHTNSSKVNYIGYSQGSGTFFIMCSERPEYCDKVNVLIGLAPASRQTNTRSLIYRALAQSFDRFSSAIVGVGEVFSIGSPGQRILASLCQFSLTSNSICGGFISAFDSRHLGSFADATMQVMYKHFPAGTSVKTMARYGQSMVSANFEKFNYGLEGNLVKYGVETPPSYNLSAVSVPVVIIYGRNDHLVDPKDIKWLAKRLPYLREVIEVTDPLWNHFDVTYSQFCSDLIFPNIYKHLISYSYN